MDAAEEHAPHPSTDAPMPSLNTVTEAQHEVSTFSSHHTLSSRNVQISSYSHPIINLNTQCDMNSTLYILIIDLNLKRRHRRQSFPRARRSRGQLHLPARNHLVPIGFHYPIRIGVLPRHCGRSRGPDTPKRQRQSSTRRRPRSPSPVMIEPTMFP
ncbi:hypothetical protein K439DRAFT_1142635 [Ramaria rubella]|nr:hypothetical protein K439DRAFT_1142635 [Ramaria rubella]